MIKINKSDSIIDIIIKINNCKQKEIVLDFPFGHPILHNYTSLKILKNKAGNKDLILITSDKTAKNIGKSLGIKYSQLGDTDLLEYNYTFLEYTKYLFKRYLTEIKQIFSNKTPDIIFEYQKKYSTSNSKIGFFLLGLLGSVLLFIFIFYFAVNKTYIEITPEISIRTKSENFIFRAASAEEVLNENIIKLTQVSKLIYLTNTFGTTGVNEDSLKRSKGKVTFYNELEEPVDLLANTRIETKDGVLFTTDTPISLDKATRTATGGIIPSHVEIKVTSSLKDSKGKIIGTRANIGTGVLLTLPGLKINNDKIYAKTTEPIDGGNENYVKKLTQEDIDNAKNILEGKLKQQALNELKKQILDDNAKNNITYDILGVDDILFYSDFKVMGDEKLKVGANIDSFDLSGTIKITSYIYNTEKVLNQMSSTIKDTMLKDVEKLLFVNDKSLRISVVLNKQDRPLEIKATAQVESFFSHNFLNEKNNYIEKLKSSIAGLEKDDAIKVLLNNQNISDVKMEIRPFFINKVSKILDNIEVSVVEKN
ncbi:MAG: hypothetical protein PHS49_02370 [Candidatus Gracilibacteria bacterium]|nr:hypothetical protein [Candidatus Gracilibacteria bacterium]